MENIKVTEERLNNQRMKVYDHNYPSISYGTAGFRMVADHQLMCVMYRVGITSALYAKYREGQAVGVMITASHNPVKDNGVKMIDEHGEMLPQNWEKEAEAIVNAGNAKDLLTEIQRIIKEYSIDISKEATIYVGMDNRPSSMQLFQNLIDGFNVFQLLNLNSIGQCSTPQLHFLVKEANEKKSGQTKTQYYNHMVTHVKSFLETVGSKNPISITVDCAYGVGANVIAEFGAALKKHGDFIRFNVINGVPTREQKQLLNDQCGADYVQKSKCFPRNMPNDVEWFASFDGDADRIVFGYDAEHFKLIDGDKISALLAKFLSKHLMILGVLDQLTMGVIQTAYANGASTAYLTSVLPNGKQDIHCTATGVKHLHVKATEYDIGIYFEANGHGTVIFSNNFKKVLDSLTPSTGEQKRSLALVKSWSNIINECVGDALSDLLACLLVFADMKELNYEKWNSFYKDYPSVLTKIEVKDRTAIKTTKDETRVIEPKSLQDLIDNHISTLASTKVKRTFVRPSGTENCVRIYAEADTPEQAVLIETNVRKFVETECA